MIQLSVALAAVTLVRLMMAATVPLAPDEAYYWIWSRALAAAYLDHPPMVALWIRAGTALAGQTVLGLRLLGPLAAAVASWMLFDVARILFPAPRVGYAAVALLNASLLLGVGTVIITPDSPLLFFWTATLWAMARLAVGGSGYWWLAAGLFGGLALDSKYTGLFLWIGIGLWVLLVPAARPWLRRWQPWAASMIGLALFLPVLIWNADHAWAGFVRQGGRVEDWRPARALGFLVELVGSQVGLATPLVWVLCVAGFIKAIGAAWRFRDTRWSLLVALSLPPILVFVQHAFGDRVQGNWPAIVYPVLAVAAAAISSRTRWWIGASMLGFAITALVYVQSGFNLIPLPPRLDPVAIRLAGWDRLASQVAVIRQANGGSFVAADGYALTSELAWWLPADIPVIGTGSRWQLLKLPLAPPGERTGILVEPARAGSGPDAAQWSRITPVGFADRPGSGTPRFILYQVTLRGDTKAVALPRP